MKANVKFIASCGADGYTSSLYRVNSKYRLTALIGNREEFEGKYERLEDAVAEMTEMFEDYVVKNCGDDEEDFLSGYSCNPDEPEECTACQ